MRLIDADKLRETMYHEAFETDTDMQKWDSGCWIRYKMFENAIENAPTIEAETVRHGYWIMLHKTHNVDEDNDYDWRCSECNHVDCHNINVEVPYCWNCGSKMC